MERLIVGVILIVVATATWGYEPPSDDELAGYWEGLTRAERIAELRKLDEIEHALPTLAMPRLVVLQTSDTVHAFHQRPLVIDVAGHLLYEIELPRVEVARVRSYSWAQGFGIGAVVGVVAASVFFATR